METRIVLQAVREELERKEALIETLKTTLAERNRRIWQLENRRPLV